MKDEPISLYVYRFSLKHWVRRNSFVQHHASWRERIEKVSSDPFFAWRLCMASHFGPKCPDLCRMRKAMERMKQNMNSDYSENKNSSKWGWDDLDSLGRIERDYVAIAKQMAFEYGYDHSSSTKPIDYQCGFSEGEHWDCWLTNHTSS